MSKRWLASLAALAAMMTIVSISMAGQAPPATAETSKAWTPSRTSWGDPDLQGLFTNNDEAGVPFERPRHFGQRQVVTDEEFAARQAQAKKIAQADDADFVPSPGVVCPDDPDGQCSDQAAFEGRASSSAEASAVLLTTNERPGTSPPPHWREDRTKPSRRTSLVVDPPDGRIPALTPEAQQRQAARAAARRQSGRGPADSWVDRSLGDRCIARGVPSSMLPGAYNNNYHILQAPNYVAIRYERMNETRIIPLDGRPHLDPAIRQYTGDARGRWEGSTLVVETTNFREDAAYRGANPKTLRVVERFRRVAPDKIEWAVTIEDPSTWTRPWTFSVPLTKDDNQRIFEYACHEGNYSMFNILSGARAEERQAQGDAGNK
jgi:hypothetical protein